MNDATAIIPKEGRRMTLAEQELVIRVARDETNVTITGSGAYWTRQLEKLLTRVPGQGEHLSAEVYRIVVPLTRLRLLAPKRQMTLSDTARENLRNRFKNSPTGVEESTPDIFDEGDGPAGAFEQKPTVLNVLSVWPPYEAAFLLHILNKIHTIRDNVPEGQQRDMR